MLCLRTCNDDDDDDELLREETNCQVCTNWDCCHFFLLLNPGTLILAAADSKPHALFASSHAPFTPQLVCRDEIKSEVDVVVEQEQEQEEEEDDEEIGGGGRRREEDGDEKTSAGIVTTKGYRKLTSTTKQLRHPSVICASSSAKLLLLLSGERTRNRQTDSQTEETRVSTLGFADSSFPRDGPQSNADKSARKAQQCPKSDEGHQKLVRQTQREREREREKERDLPRA